MPPAARYTIVRKLATGGMAEIFLATQHGPRGFEKQVVLKRILAALYADPQFRDMLIDEARVSVGLAHSNIAQLLDLGSAAGRYFLVFELVDGWDLGRLIERAHRADVPIPPELGLFIIAETCRGLAYAHSKTQDDKPLNIVHRDVSPQNVLISEHGEVKVADFGIAKAMTKRDRTGSGVVKGKVAFMSPEQASGRPVDARSDLFAAGTMLYLLATGRRPFDAPTDLEVLYRVQNGTFDPPEVAQPGIEPELATVINKAMRADPSERYQSAEEMLVAIERLLRNVYQPAGQTELKQWLRGLSAIDGELPISRAPAEAKEPSTARELRAGNTLVLDAPVRAARRRSTEALASAPTLSVRTAPGPTREDLQIVVAEDAPPESRLQAESRRHGTVWALVLLLLAAGGGIAFWRVARRSEQAVPPPTAVPAASTDAPSPSPPTAIPTPMGDEAQPGSEQATEQAQPGTAPGVGFGPGAADLESLGTQPGSGRSEGVGAAESPGARITPPPPPATGTGIRATRPSTAGSREPAPGSPPSDGFGATPTGPRSGGQPSGAGGASPEPPKPPPAATQAPADRSPPAGNSGHASDSVAPPVPAREPEPAQPSTPPQVAPPTPPSAPPPTSAPNPPNTETSPATPPSAADSRG